MTKRFFVSCLIGAALMSWGGASIASELSFNGWRQMNVPFFAIGIILLAQAPYTSLNAKIRDLESRLAASPSESNARAG